jgi:hypothetical protein
LSLDAVAERLHDSIVGVQRHEMIPPQARFVVAADTAGSVGCRRRSHIGRPADSS